MLNIEDMYLEMGIRKEVYDFGSQIEGTLKERFDAIDKVAEYNQLKVVHAMQKCKVNAGCFKYASGYGYDDPGRDTLEEVYAEIFHTESALVRPQITCGTHALALALAANLRPGDELLSPVGKPYDTLEEVIGIRPSNGSLAEYGISYRQVDLLEGGAARRVQRFQNTRIQIGDGGNIHLGNHADGADALRNHAAERARSGHANPNQRPDDGGQRADEQNQRVEDERDGLGHDLRAGQKADGQGQNAADHCAEDGDADRFHQQIRHAVGRGGKQEVHIRLDQTPENALGDFRALGRKAFEGYAGGRPAQQQRHDEHGERVKPPFARAGFVLFKDVV